MNINFFEKKDQYGELPATDLEEEIDTLTPVFLIANSRYETTA